MTDDQTPAQEAGDEDIVYNPVEKAEAPENTDGQVKDQPASDGDDAPEGDDDHSEDKKSKSAIRREKRRENEQRLREQAEEATRKAKDAQDRLNRIKSFAESEQEPKESDFEDSFEYSAARALWKQSQRVASREQEEISAEAKRYEEQAAKFEEERRAERQAAYLVQADEARTKYTDFDKVVATVTRADVLAPQVADMVLESDAAADVAYHLGKNPALARELSRMSPLSAARELGRIEALLSKPQARTQSAAPEPITPVKGTGTVQKDPHKMTQAEFNAWREAGGTF